MFGQTLTEHVDIDVLRVLIGTLLLIFGMQWLRKAILRATGWKSLHDEVGIYRDNVRELGGAGPARVGFMDWLGFTVSFKGVFLEGLEVAFIVLTFGTSLGVVTLGSMTMSGVEGASYAALAALLLVIVVGAAVHKPLALVPENQLKFVVGIMLTAFGTFWAGEGIGVEWPGADYAILALLALYSIAAWIAVITMKRATEMAAAS